MSDTKLIMTETSDMIEEDIAKDVLENICNMTGVEKNIQVLFLCCIEDLY